MSQSFLDKAGLPLGLRNNNPGNIRFGQGFIGEIGKDANGFSRFSDVTLGVRAMMLDIINKMKRGLTSLNLIIPAYAPRSENDTDAYISQVSIYTGFSPDQVLQPDQQTILKIVKGMISVEVGTYYQSMISDETYQSAQNMLSSKFAAGLNAVAEKVKSVTGLDISPVVIVLLGCLTLYFLFR